METFVVRVFAADGVDRLSGVLEHPVTGTRIPFRDLDDLIVQVLLALGREDAGARLPANASGARQVGE